METPADHKKELDIDNMSVDGEFNRQDNSADNEEEGEDEDEDEDEDEEEDNDDNDDEDGLPPPP